MNLHHASNTISAIVDLPGPDTQNTHRPLPLYRPLSVSNPIVMLPRADLKSKLQICGFYKMST